jgi:hypothetical protein
VGNNAASGTNKVNEVRRPNGTNTKAAVARNVGANTLRPGLVSRQQHSPTPSTSSISSDSKGGETSSSVAADILNVLALPKKKKRAAWDTKGRLEDMEELTGTLHQLLHTSATNMTDLTSKLETSESKSKLISSVYTRSHNNYPSTNSWTCFSLFIVSELESFRQTLQSKVAVKESENKDILQKMHHVEQDLQVLD